MAKRYFDLLTKAANLSASHKRVYFLSHTDQNDQGKVKAKTITLGLIQEHFDVLRKHPKGSTEYANAWCGIETLVDGRDEQPKTALTAGD